MNELVVPDLMGQAIPVPSMPEQKVIGDCLTSLDNLITLHQREVDMLKRVKSTLLRKVFV